MTKDVLPPGKILKVVIADDHTLFRAGVKTALSLRKNVELVGEADNGKQLLNLLKYIIPDVILLDIQMPIMDGIEALPEVRKLYPDIKIIVLSMHDDASVISKMMEIGANSYLTKSSDSEAIYQAIITCYLEEFYFNDLTNKAVLNGLRTKRSEEKTQVQDIQLSEKEISILRYLCEEKSTKDIAELVDLSPRTVESIRDKLRSKVGVKTVVGLIMFAVKQGLLEEQ